MPTDFLGNSITGGDPATIAGIDDFIGGMLAYETRAVNILPAANVAPDHCLANALAGFLHLTAEHPSAADAAQPYLRAAEAVAGSATPREQRTVAALRQWIEDDIDATVATLGAIVANHPRDLLALKLLHYHLFNQGDFPAMLRAALPAAEAAPEVPYCHGMIAFGYEQCHLLDAAETAASHALAQTEREPWAQHALAHVMLTQGRIDEGVAFLEGARPTWTGLNSFMITHLWWHLALFYLAQGREADALDAYDAQVWAVAKDYSQDQVNAVSLLARLELGGANVGDRWREIGGYLAARAADVGQPFLSVQYLYGLARAGRPEADMLLAAIEAREGDVWRTVARPLARGLVAHARGDFATAAVLLAEAMPHLIRLGGSHAQRDLFDQILLDANVRAGNLVEAQQALELRRASHPDDPALNRRLAGVYRALGLPTLADEADARVRRRLAA